MKTDFIDKLACPNEFIPVELGKDGLQGKGSGVRYPIYDGVPFLFRFPLASLNEWAARLKSEVLKIQRQISSVDVQMKDAELGALAKERLEKFRVGLTEHLKLMKDFVAPLEIDLDENAKVQSALLSGLPSNQSVFGYATNFFRDWSWGEEENQLSLEFIRKLRPFSKKDASNTKKQWAILGSGFGRLAYDVHRHFENEMSVAIDLNPYAILSSKKMISEGKMKWVEFPRSPKDPLNAAVVQSCEAEPISNDSFYHVAGDATRPPFAKQSFDVVLTPWFIDIVPERTDVLMNEINRILKPGGKWIQFGPLSFEKKLQKDRPSQEELFEIGEKQGFKMLGHFDDEMPYLKSPHSRAYDVRTVTTFCLEKTKDVPTLSAAGMTYLPPWLEDLTMPIVKTDTLSAHSQMNEIISKLLRLIDGKKSVLDLADELGEAYQTDKGELVESIRLFLTKLTDANQFRFGNDMGSANL